MLARHQATRNRIAKPAIAVRTVALVLLAPLPLATMARGALGEVQSHQKISDTQGGFAGTLENLDGDGDGMPDSSESRNSFGPRTPGRSTHVGIYCNKNKHCPQFVNRVASLGYSTTHWISPSQVDPNSLAGIDVLFVHSTEASDLASKDAVIGAWVFEGHGLIVEQPNDEGDVSILPPGLAINIWSRAYDGSPSGPDPVRNVQITALGASHPIMSGLTTGDICENVDQVWTWDVSSAYDILGVQETNTDYAAVAAAAYGRGRVVFHTGNTNPRSFKPGSDQYLQQMIDWAAEVEQGSIPTIVSLDIKPGSCPNPVNRRSRGAIPVAIVGSLDFDVTTIDPYLLRLSRSDGVGGSISPLLGTSRRRGPGVVIEDVATPFGDEPCSCHELNGDGIDDLLLKFSSSEMNRAFDLDEFPRGASIELVLEGALEDGTLFEGVDCIVISGTHRDRHGPRRNNRGK